jgi:hypothetical protein
VNGAHETLSGPATRELLERTLHDFGDQRFCRRAQLSAAHLYRPRRSRREPERLAGNTLKSWAA